MPTLILRARSAAVYANPTGFADVVGGTDALADQSDASYVKLGVDYTSGSNIRDYITCQFDHFDSALIDSITARRIFIRVSGETTDLGAGQGDFTFGDGSPGTAPTQDIFMNVDPTYLLMFSPRTIGTPDALDPALTPLNTDDTWFIQAPSVVDPSFPASGSGTSRWHMYEAWIELDYDSPPITSNEGPTHAPPRRIHPRDDQYGTSSHARLWPPPSSIQASNRPTGYL